MAAASKMPGVCSRTLGQMELVMLGALHALEGSTDLAELETRLHRFNIFRVMKFEHGEIRHSNMLAWLFQPRESHGLGVSFLRRWLVRVMSDCASAVPSGFSPVEIEKWVIGRVEVKREWNHLDLLIRIAIANNDVRVVAIENKLRASQSKGQLVGYRRKVGAAYPEAQAAFLFLTERDEEPEDSAFLNASHQQVHDALAACLRERTGAAGGEAEVLMKHYLNILEERNMGNPQVAELAKRIYRDHRLAMEKIFEYRTDVCQCLTDVVEREMKDSTVVAEINPMVTNRGIVRFLPNAWKTAANLSGKAWGETGSAHILCEINVGAKSPRLEVVVGANAPNNWKRDLWKIAKKEGFENVSLKSGTEAEWMRVFSARCPVTPYDSEDLDEAGREIWRWCSEQIADGEFRRVVKLVAEHVKRLP